MINITEENIGQEFRLKDIDEKRNYFIEEIKQNELVSKNHKKICKIWRRTELFIRKLNYKTILFYCLKCRKNTKSINPMGENTEIGKIMVLSNCVVCGSKKIKND